MVQNHTWKRRNQGNSSTKEITIKIDASCHVEIPISIYLSKSSAASDISIIGADWVHPTLMRINSGTSWGMGTAAIRGTSLTTFQPLFSREKAGFSQVCCQREVGGEDRVSTWISPGIQRGCGGGASCPEPDSAAGMGFRPLGTMVKEGTCSCQGFLPTAQPISRWSIRKGGISLARNVTELCITLGFCPVHPDISKIKHTGVPAMAGRKMQSMSMAPVLEGRRLGASHQCVQRR